VIMSIIAFTETGEDRRGGADRVSELISFGGGVNSTAMTILLVNEGWRGPIVFADTGCEWPETYCYMDYFQREWLRPRGLEVVQLGGEYRAQEHGRDRRTLIEYCEHYRLTPYAGARWCTAGWKTDVLDHWAAAHGVDVQLIGIAADEAHRRKGRVCPLIDRGITRARCIEIIQAEGLDVPQKSGCYICPFQRWLQFAELYRRHPELYERAANLERLATERRGSKTVLHISSKVTLDEFRRGLNSQTSWLDDSELDGLLAYRPCVCGV